MSPPLAAIDMLLLPMAAAAAFMALLTLAIWLGRPQEGLPLWTAAWSANTVVYHVGHHVQVSLGLGSWAVLGARMTWSSGMVMVPLLIGVVHALAGLRPSRRLLSVLGVATPVLLAFIWLTHLVVSDQPYLRTDLVGHEYLALEPGPLTWLPALGALASYSYALGVLWRSPTLRPGERRMLMAGLAVYLLLGVNDILHAARIITSVRVFDFAFLAVAFGLALIGIQRYNRLNSRLEAEVVERTDDLRARQAELTALSGVQQTMVSTLSLSAVLDTIAEAAVGLIDAGAAAVYELRGEDGLLHRRAVHAAMPEDIFQALRVGQGAAGTAALTRAPAGSPDITAHPLPGYDLTLPLSDRTMREELDRQPFRASLGIPLISKAAVLGAISVYWREPHVVTGRELRLLTALAQQAAVAMENARLYESEAAARRQAETALVQVKQLHGLLPICAWCKKVRNDQNYWEQIESYVSQRSAATFSHGICPECRDRMRATPA